MDTQEGHENDLLVEFCTRNHIKFKNLYYLRWAVTHRSYLNENPGEQQDNERLEFLGDAVLDFLVGAWLYDHFPEFHEGQMTRYRAALVGNHQLADYARKIGLGGLLRMGKGELENGGRERVALLGSAFEALVGALYQDQGMDEVRNFVLPFLQTVVDEMAAAGKDLDAKSKLQEWAQSQKLGSPVYQTVASLGPDHDKVFQVEAVISDKVYGRGEGKSKQQAAKAAAEDALQRISKEMTEPC